MIIELLGWYKLRLSSRQVPDVVVEPISSLKSCSSTSSFGNSNWSVTSSSIPSLSACVSTSSSCGGVNGICEGGSIITIIGGGDSDCDKRDHKDTKIIEEEEPKQQQEQEPMRMPENLLLCRNTTTYTTERTTVRDQFRGGVFRGAEKEEELKAAAKAASASL